MIFVIIGILLTATIAVTMIVISDKKRSRSRAQMRKKKQPYLISLSSYLRISRWLDRFFLTRGGYRKVKSRIAILSIYTNQEIQVFAVRVYVIALGSASGLIVAGAIIFRDLFSTLLVAIYAVVVHHVLVGKQIDRVHYKLLQQLSQALSNLRQNYLRLNSIPQAVAETETGAELYRAFEEIYNILTDPDGQRRLNEFYAATPFKLLCTLAGVCYILNNAGDTRLRDGTSNFIQAMGMMSDEVNLEIRRIALQKARFGLLEYLPIMPLFAIGVIESFFTSIIPGTAIIYHGMLGYIARTVIILASIIGYTVIVKINSAVSVKQDDRTAFILQLLKRDWFAKFIQDITPKKRIKRNRKIRLLKTSLSLQDLSHLYASKLLYAIAAFFVALICLYFSVNLGKEFILNNVREVSLIGGESLDEEDIRIRREMDAVYLSAPRLPTDRETTDFVLAYLPELPAYDQAAQVKRLKEKYVRYYNTYFKWWMVLIAFGASLLAYKLPDLMLRGRAWLLKTESEEDVLQMQTIISILMNTSVDTMETLYWLEKQSRVHKHALLDAYHEYPSNPDLSLNRLKAKAVVPGFHRMVDKLLLTIHQISLAEAFSDLVAERDHVMRIREISQNTTLNKKRTFVSPLAMAPLMLTAFLYILIPLGVLGFREFMDALANVNF